MIESTGRLEVLVFEVDLCLKDLSNPIVEQY